MKKLKSLLFVFTISFITISASAQSSKQSSSVQIAGSYKAEPVDGDTETCDISVKIMQVRQLYYYVLKIDNTVHKGWLKISKGDTPKEKYVTFNGIKWAEYEGDVSNLDDNAPRPNLKLPIGIDGVFSDNGITIQNSGNAMNYYVKIEGCSQKFIRLVKTSK